MPSSSRHGYGEVATLELPDATQSTWCWTAEQTRINSPQLPRPPLLLTADQHTTVLLRRALLYPVLSETGTELRKSCGSAVPALQKRWIPAHRFRSRFQESGLWFEKCHRGRRHSGCAPRSGGFETAGGTWWKAPMVTAPVTRCPAPVNCI